MSFDSQTNGSHATHANVRDLSRDTRSTKRHVKLTEDDEKMIVLQSWYQRMSAERIGRHHGVPVAQVRLILAQRMGGNC